MARGLLRAGWVPVAQERTGRPTPPRAGPAALGTTVHPVEEAESAEHQSRELRRAVKGAENTPSHLIVPVTCSQQVKTILLT